MATLEEIGRALKNADAAAERGVEGAADDARRLAIEYKRLKATQPDIDNNSTLGFVNKGIADFVDLVNPLDDPWAARFGIQTPKMAEVMRGDNNPNRPDFLRAAAADREPETFLEGFGQGAGEALASLPLVGGALSQVKPALGAAGMAASRLGRFGQTLVGAADDAARGLRTKSGAAIEPAASGLVRGEEIEMRNLGYPDWLAQSVAVMSPLAAVPAVGAGKEVLRTGRDMASSVGSAVNKLPVVNTVTRLGKSMFPMTETGAHKIASERMIEVAGGPDRAADISGRIGTDRRAIEDTIKVLERDLSNATDPADIQRIQSELDANNKLLNMATSQTPAQQTGDRRMLELERAAIAEEPKVEDAVQRMAETFRADALEVLARTQDGSPAETRAFFNNRLKTFKNDLNTRVERAIASGDEQLESLGVPGGDEGISTSVVDRLERARHAARIEAEGKWSLVPKDEPVRVDSAIAAARRWEADIGDARQVDIPAEVKQYLLGNAEYAAGTSVRDAHALASKLRQIARNASSGLDRNDTMARVANDIATALEADLDAIDPTTESGRLIKDALAATRALHETFDQGAVGRMLARTKARAASLEPGAALGKTVGVGKETGAAAFDKIVDAEPTVQDDIADFLRGRFLAETYTTDAKGQDAFNPRRATNWLKNNAATLERMPELRNEMREALTSRNAAEAFKLKASAREKMLGDGALTDFTDRPIDKAAYAILSADDPIAAAKSLVNTARKDNTGAAMAGLKTSVTDNLILNARDKHGILRGESLNNLLKDPHYSNALLEIYSGDELTRMMVVARQSAMLDKAEGSKSLGAVIDAPSNMLTSLLARVSGAKAGSALGAGPGMGGSLQSANIFSNLARTTLHNITNRRAREILKEAITDPDLFKYLLNPEYGTAKFADLPKPVQNKLAPYVMGSIVGQGAEAVRGAAGGVMGFLTGENEDRSSIFDFMGAN